MSEKARKRTDFVGTTSVGVGAPAADGVYVEEQGGRGVHRTVIGLNKVKVTVGNTTGVSFGGTKIYDFPAGLILVKQCVMKDIVVGLDNAGNVTPIDAADGGDISLGSTPPSDGTLAGTDVNLCPSTSIDPLSTGIATANLAASAQLGSQAAPLDMYLNMLIDDADVGDGASDVLEITGTIIVTWENIHGED